MNDLLWLLIGLGGGVLLAIALPGTATVTRSVMANRRLGVIAGGGIGAVLVARGLVMAMPSTETEGLTTAAAALAGALWVSGIVGITLVRRRHGEDLGIDLNTPATTRPADMPAYDATRQAIVDGLTEDATAHDACRYEEVGRRFAAVRGRIPDDTAQTTKLHTALRFWRGWIQARDARWPGLDVPGGIGIAEWPQLARTIASDLALDSEVSSPRVRDRFGSTVQPLQPLPDDQPATTTAVWSHT